MIEIKSFITQQVIYKSELPSLREAVVKAVEEGAYLRGANLADANLTDANLADANLRGAYLTGAYLRGANLADANLTDANLADANLRGAYLTGADLRGAYLTGADLTGAYLTGADLTGAYLTGAYLENTTNPEGHCFLTAQFGRGQIIAVSSELVSIGCESHTISHWVENYEKIGKKHDYTQLEIEDYGKALRLMKAILDRRAEVKE